VTNENPIELSPPGAGLPAVELAVARFLFFVARLLMSRQNAVQRFEQEAGRMIQMVQGMPIEKAQRPVLIPRVRGIEDSSRNWSVLMTLDHLIIVDQGIVNIIEGLVQGKTPSRKVSIADVKPAIDQSPETIRRFQIVMSEFLERVERIEDLRTKTKCEHPWFGPLDGNGWCCLAAIHHTIHRRQIEKIVEVQKSMTCSIS
jgi:hypothetical protein